MIDCIVVGLGGCIGSILRYLIGKLPISTQGFPWTTFGINLLGCFLIGCIVMVASKNTDIDPRWILFFKVGICGGFTTFSTFSLETSQLFQSGQYGLAILYVILSVVLGIILAFLPQMTMK